MKLLGAFKNFIEAIDWNELDVNEKQGLFDALESSCPIDLGIFEMVQAKGSDENLVLYYKGTKPPYPQLFLTPEIKTYFKSWLERCKTKGENGWSYLEWQKQIEKED